MLKLFLADLRYKQKVFADDGAPTGLAKILLSDGSGANFWYRLMQVCAKRKITLPLALIFQYVNKLLNHCVIGLGVEFGEGFVLMHPTGVVINSKVKGGVGVVLESGVVIGDNRGRSPVLGSHIFIGAGAKVIGGISLADDVRVGANAVVVKDVASGQTVVGIPAKPVSKE